MTVAAGVREPTLQEQLAGMAVGATSRTYDMAVDQEILPRKLSLRAAYFHNQFAHESETLGLAPLRLGNGLGYRTQGLELTAQYHPFLRVMVRGGYTYLAALVEQSGAVAVFNPGIPGVPIGALTALVGGRPFHRPPNTGFVTVAYSGNRMMASVKDSFTGTSDDSTNLYLNKNLLLPNRNLSAGFASVDADVSYRVTRHLSLFSEFRNLLNQRGIAPIGYLSAPFGVRAGVRITVGRE
jgi:iron complex outermembrane receptor protein/vitamin B12 transporter